MGVITNKTIILKALQEGNNTSLNGGILKIDLLRTTATLSLPSLNLFQDENAYLIIASETSNLTHFKLLNSKRQEIAITKSLLSGEVSALIAVCNGSITTPLLFGSEAEKEVNPRDLIEYAKNIEKKNKASAAQKSAADDELEKEQEKLQCLTDYDDEAIAEVNYYDYNQEGENQNATICEQNACSFNANFKKNAQEKDECRPSGYEASPCDAECKKEPEYYRSIKEKIAPLFIKYPSIDALTAIIPYSKWVKIPIDNCKHYALGAIKEKGEMKYLVYGVPGFYSSKPNGIENNSCFIPLSIFNPLGEGYWCIFQEAESGKPLQRGITI